MSTDLGLSMPFLFSLENFLIIHFLYIHEDVKIVKKLISMVLVQIKKSLSHTASYWPSKLQ